jgi:hypothetical protein
MAKESEEDEESNVQLDIRATTEIEPRLVL